MVKPFFIAQSSIIHVWLTKNGKKGKAFHKKLMKSRFTKKTERKAYCKKHGLPRSLPYLRASLLCIIGLFPNAFETILQKFQAWWSPMHGLPSYHEQETVRPECVNAKILRLSQHELLSQSVSNERGG